DCDKAIKLDIGAISAYVNRCEAFINLRDYKAAWTDCEKAIELKPEKLEMYFKKGQILAFLDKHEEAIIEFSNLIQITNLETDNNKQSQLDYSMFVELFLHRSKSFEALGKQEKANEDYQEFLLRQSTP
ncbi:MAG: tetratricopeptide repeat protein, partial [Gemmataceae bacterium]